MKIALAQLNYHIGNFEANRDQIIQNIEKAKDQGAELIVFSELAVCGYYPNDLLERREFIDKCIDSINRIALYCHGIAALVGGPSINKSPNGKMLFNSANRPLICFWVRLTVRWCEKPSSRARSFKRASAKL